MYIYVNMYYVSAQGINERMINVHYYYYYADVVWIPWCCKGLFSQSELSLIADSFTVCIQLLCFTWS